MQDITTSVGLKGIQDLVEGPFQELHYVAFKILWLISEEHKKMVSSCSIRRSFMTSIFGYVSWNVSVLYNLVETILDPVGLSFRVKV